MALLTSTFLRRLALPLRSASPRAYAALNALRRRWMVRGRDLDAYQANALDRFQRHAQVSGATILEVGSDGEKRVLRALREAGAAHAWGVNPAREFFSEGESRRETDGGRVVLHRADATELPFADASIDHVFSIATFEHIADLGAALRELHRVLVPGGLVYSHFGPIWSAGKGHHVVVEVDGERAWHGDPRQNPIPDYAHLLLDQAQLTAGLGGRCGEALCDAIGEFVFHDDYVNRLFHHHYRELFAASPFEVLHLDGERDAIAPQLEAVLSLAYPEEPNFDVTNVEVVLRKRC